MKYYFFLEDMSALDKMIYEQEDRVTQLAKEQGEAASQSTENFGHDDACQEAVDHERRLTIGRLRELRKIVSNSIVITQQEVLCHGALDSVRMGATVELSDGRVLRIGSFMVLAKSPVENISYRTPLARALLNKKEGDEVEFNGQSFKIVKIY